MGHHDHFQCRKCQSVFDLAICPSGLHSGMTLPGGFVVEDHEMTVYGLCADCSSSGESSARTTKSSRSTKS
jgi:Fur family ferric uptake transcriptional regulator